MHKCYLGLKLLSLASCCRALPGLPSLLALPKRKQKASASSLGDPPTACRLKGTNGLSPHPFLRRLHRVGTPPAERMHGTAMRRQGRGLFIILVVRQPAPLASSTGHPSGENGVEQKAV
ncbi:hypothetical protein [Dysgonomonas sp. 521]|uniref:hypothetical protein n=1 Tax=Dysgonomonas sp. 521 TaxID=2302932 RepID=UPI00210830F7|nr:hypothetical protein [Dysgonomonas sp. 521]